MAKENLLKTPAIVSLANFQFFKFCCDIQGSHLIGYLRVSLIIDQSECLICFFLCTELTLFCTELPEDCICYNQPKLSNFSMYIINIEIIRENCGNYDKKRFILKVVASPKTMCILGFLWSQNVSGFPQKTINLHKADEWY